MTIDESQETGATSSEVMLPSRSAWVSPLWTQAELPKRVVFAREDHRRKEAVQSMSYVCRFTGGLVPVPSVTEVGFLISFGCIANWLIDRWDVTRQFKLWYSYIFRFTDVMS
jgi:hypothetical protein